MKIESVMPDAIYAGDEDTEYEIFDSAVIVP